ncbi:MAG: DMT family transporter [Leptospirales bacterium]|jgi:drug/metabolite transporter (DMT)-like permease
MQPSEAAETPVRSLSVAIEAIVALTFWASVPVVVRFIQANPFTIGLFRLTVATVLLRILFVRREALRNLKRRDWFGLAAIGLIFGVHWVLYFFSIKVGSASIGAIGLAGYGAFLIVLSAIVDRVRLTFVDLAAVGLCVVGSLFLIPNFDANSHVVQGLLLGAGSAFCFACLPILHRRFRHIGSGVRATGQFGFALPVFLLGAPLADFRGLPISDWWWLAYLAIFCTVIGHGLWVRVTTVLEPMTTSTVYYLYLPLSLSFSYLFLGEALDVKILFGAAFIALGSILGIRNQSRKIRRAQARSDDAGK